MAATTRVLMEEPTAARRPKASATGIPHIRASVRSRRRWSVPAEAVDFAVDDQAGVDIGIILEDQAGGNELVGRP